VAKNGLGGFGNGGDGYFTATVATKISAVAIGTACTVGGSYCDGWRQCSSSGLDSSINGGASSRDGGGG
jgi:hypothetical protein